MSGSHLFLKLSMCLCLLAGTVSFPGCDSVPTWDELTGDEEEEAAPIKSQPAPVKPDKPVKSKPKPKPKPIVVKIEPEEALATFQKMRSRDVTDDTFERLVRDMGDKIDIVEELNLAQSKVTLASFRQIDQFTGLRSLNVTQLTLDEETIERIGKMTQLETLILDNISNINTETLMFLDNLINLKSLSLKNTSIKDEAFEALLNLDNLEFLDISGTNITGSGFYECRKKKKLKNLKHINANSTGFGHYGFAGIKGLANLEVLLVRKAIVTDPSLGGLKGLKNLKRLDLGYNSLSDEGVKHIAKVKSLESLNLHNSKRVTNQGLKLMTKLKNLTKLSLTGTRCSAGGIAAFKKKVKNCSVQIDGKIF